MAIRRLEKFREARRSRRRYLCAFLLFFLLVMLGVCIADFSINNMMKNQSGIELVHFQKINESFLEISLLDKKFYIDTSYVNRDFQNLKRKMFKGKQALRRFPFLLRLMPDDIIILKKFKKHKLFCGNNDRWPVLRKSLRTTEVMFSFDAMHQYVQCRIAPLLILLRLMPDYAII